MCAPSRSAAPWKPHCVLSASCSTGQKRAASSMRRSKSSGDSSADSLLDTRPRTTTFPFGTKRSGSNPPMTSVSYSEQEPVDVQLVEEALGEPVVRPRPVRPGRTTSTAQMHRARHTAGDGIVARVVGGDVGSQHVHRRAAGALEFAAPIRIDVGVEAFVELDVGRRRRRPRAPRTPRARSPWYPRGALRASGRRSP